MNLITFDGDLRKLPGRTRTFLSDWERPLRYKFKARAWDKANIEKRRESSRRSKARCRLLYGRKPDRNRPRFLYLDKRTVKHLDTHSVIDSGALDPCQILMQKEEEDLAVD